jgi:hypothetical protein
MMGGYSRAYLIIFLEVLHETMLINIILKWVIKKMKIMAKKCTMTAVSITV